MGAAVTDAMGRQAPEGLLGIHLNLLRRALGNVGCLPRNSEEERAALAAIATFRTGGYGYFIEQATRPQTIGYALLDSPVALAAWMLDHDTDSYYKISRAFTRRAALRRPHPGAHPGQHHAVLADRHRGLGRPLVLGGRASRSPRGRAGPSGGQAPGRLHHLPRRDLPGSPQLGREVLPQPHLLPRSRQGRPLRGLGGAPTVFRRAPRGLPAAPLADGTPGKGGSRREVWTPRCWCRTRPETPRRGRCDAAPVTHQPNRLRHEGRDTDHEYRHCGQEHRSSRPTVSRRYCRRGDRRPSATGRGMAAARTRTCR